MAILAERPNDHIIHMYKLGFRTEYAGTKDEYDKWIELGYTAEKANVEHQEFPRTLYSLDGDSIEVGTYDPKTGEIGVVDAHGHRNPGLPACYAREAELLAQGWQRKAVAPKEMTQLAGGEKGLAMQNSRIEKVEQDVRDMKNTLGEILEALRPKRGPGRPKREEVEA